VTQEVFLASSNWRKDLAGLVSVLLFALLVYATVSFGFDPSRAQHPKSASVEAIGRALLSPDRGGFVLPFEIISLVLVAALVGAITIARSDQPTPRLKEDKQ
jgi:NADH-quinone oxidoreductase subunit J